MDLRSSPWRRGPTSRGDKVASDSAGDEPAKLAAATDGDPATAAVLPEAPGSWVEIDLGRDRTLGEIALRPGAAFWKR